MKSIDPKTKQYIDLKKVENVRTNLAAIAYFCTPGTFRSFVDTAEYAEEHLNDLFEKNKLPYDPVSNKGFAKENYKEAVELLMHNFSKEKFDDVLKIGNVLFKTTKVDRSEERKESSSSGSKANSNDSQKKVEKQSSVSSLVIGVTAAVVVYLVYKLIK